MKFSLYSFKIGLISFLIVLLLMPIGHTLMVLNELLLDDHKFIGAFLIGMLGLAFLIFGVVKNKQRNTATIMGLISGILIWTGWVEFSFVWSAEKLEVAPLMENDIVVTKSEYLVMLSSIGLLTTFLVFYLFTKTNCTYFSWFQKHFNLRKYVHIRGEVLRPLALITFVETIMLLWTFYIVLLVVYDNDIFGDRHPATAFVAIGSFIWSLYLIVKLFKLSKLDYAVRYAIPTVIIFWNVVEIFGRWNFLKEIWVFPIEHTIENIGIAALLIGVVIYYRYVQKRKKMTVMKQK